MKKNIQIYLISGFLGSGKTTFLKQLLEQNNGKKIGVIVNEFGNIGIDGTVLKKKQLEIVEINNGSIFCSCLKDNFVKTLVAFLELPIDILFIEASGMADPSSMKLLLGQLNALLENKPEIIRQYKYEGSICLIDAARFLEFCEIFQPTTNQVRKSSLVIVNKVDEVAEERIEKIHTRISELNNHAFIYNTTFGRIPIDMIENKVSPDGIFEGETTNTIMNRPKSYVLQLNEKYDLDSMKQFSLEMSENVLRFKGFFVTTSGNIAHADCVGDYIKINILTNEEIEVENLHKIVMIGNSGIDFKENIKKVWDKYFAYNKLIFV
jgi:G3E family GTPase